MQQYSFFGIPSIFSRQALASSHPRILARLQSGDSDAILRGACDVGDDVQGIDDDDDVQGIDDDDDVQGIDDDDDDDDDDVQGIDDDDDDDDDDVQGIDDDGIRKLNWAVMLCKK